MQSTFRSDTAWPDYIRLHFEQADDLGTMESRYYGPYNALLNYVSGDPARYLVAPQASVAHVGRDAVDFILWYVVRDMVGRVAMVVEVKDKGWASSPERRRSADEQMRRRFDALVGLPTTPKVYGISALGTRVCIYALDTSTGVVDPPLVSRPDEARVLPKDFLAGRWDSDVLDQSSFDALRDVMLDVDSMCP